MEIKELLEMDMGTVVEWLIDNQNKFCLIAKDIPKADKEPVANGLCSDGLDLLLEDIKSQYKWFDNEVNRTKREVLKADEYACGSRDAYGYMIESVEVVKRA